jgi:hypothetical protein
LHVTTVASIAAKSKEVSVATAEAKAVAAEEKVTTARAIAAGRGGCARR